MAFLQKRNLESHRDDLTMYLTDRTFGYMLKAKHSCGECGVDIPEHNYIHNGDDPVPFDAPDPVGLTNEHGSTWKIEFQHWTHVLIY